MKAFNLECARLRTRMREIRKDIHEKNKHQQTLKNDLKGILDEKDYEWLIKAVDKSSQNEKKKVKERQIDKYNGLVDEKNLEKEKALKHYQHEESKNTEGGC